MEVFPAKILQLNEMLKGENLSLGRVSDVRDEAANSIQLLSVRAAAAADGAPAKKRPKIQEAVIPTNRILLDVTHCHSLTL